MRHAGLAITLLLTVLVAGAGAVAVLIPLSPTASIIFLAFIPAVFAASVVALLVKNGVPRAIELVPDGVVAYFVGFSRTFRAEDIRSTEVLVDPVSAALVFHLRDNHVSGLSDVEPEIVSEVVSHLRLLGVAQRPTQHLLVQKRDFRSP